MSVTGTGEERVSLALAAAATLYLDAIEHGRRLAATEIAADLVELGVPTELVVSDVLARAQAAVGEGWEQHRWSIAMEHRASEITESVLLALCDAARRLPDAVAEGAAGRAVVACCEGEWHTLPARMAAEVLRLRGLDVTFVGTSVPADDLASFLHEDHPRVVVVSCSMPWNLVGAWTTISALRALGATVVFGGRGFGPNGFWGWALGGDLWARDFSHGADLALSATVGPARPPRPAAGDAASVAELRFLLRERDELIHAAMATALRWDPTLAGNDADLRVTREDLAVALQVVSSATIVGDSTVATDYVTWVESMLTARRLPLVTVARAFNCLLDILPDEVPRARTMAMTGRSSCGQVLA